eukprot:COSAG06_NODE_20600_length_788_cov_2.767779_2_plen_72_part_00
MQEEPQPEAQDDKAATKAAKKVEVEAQKREKEVAKAAVRSRTEGLSPRCESIPTSSQALSNMFIRARLSQY